MVHSSRSDSRVSLLQRVAADESGAMRSSRLDGSSQAPVPERADVQQSCNLRRECVGRGQMVLKAHQETREAPLYDKQLVVAERCAAETWPAP